MLFSYNKRTRNQQRAQPHYHKHDFLLAHAAEIITAQLAEFQHNFSHILEIDARYGHLTHPLRALYPNTQYTAHQIVAMSSMPENVYMLPPSDIDEIITPERFDLLTSSCSLQWANDPIQTLTNYNNLLSDEGILICSFLGGKTLSSFRKSLATYESRYSNGAGQRISPMIRHEDCSMIVKQAGFENYVIDSEIVRVNYSSYKSLATDLRYMGEGAAWNSPSHTQHPLTRNVLNALQNEGRFTEYFEILTITASKKRHGFKKQFKLSQN